MQPAPIPQLTILPISIQKIKITTAQAREALPLHLHHRVSSNSARGNYYISSWMSASVSFFKKLNLKRTFHVCTDIVGFFWASKLNTTTLLICFRNVKSLLRSSAQSRSSSKRTTRQWENATDRWRRFAVDKAPRSAGPSMKHLVAPSRHYYALSN